MLSIFRNCAETISSAAKRGGLVVFVLWLSIQLCVLTPAQAQAPQADALSELPQALSRETGLTVLEVEAALGEIQAMKRTNHPMVVHFAVKSSTLEHIGRLLEASSFIRLSSIDRQNALIFGGQVGATFLTFERPSDVIRKGERWFPDELPQVRTGHRRSRPVSLMGPYADWSAEAAAFAAAWNCMPRSIWEDPSANPFDRFPEGHHVMLPLVVVDGRDVDDAAFSRCVREWNGREDLPSQQHDQLDALIPHVETVLKAKFANFLQQHRCQGSGADDCVLVLHWWSSLAPEDPQLARWMQALATEVGMGTPLPELIQDRSTSLPPHRTPQARYAQAWRRAAFVHSKVLSLLKVPHAWPADALGASMREMDDLAKILEESHYEDGIPLIFNPWAALRYERQAKKLPPSSQVQKTWKLQLRDSATIDKVDREVWALLEERSEVGCDAEKRWLTTRMQIDWLHRTLAENRPTLPTCLRPDPLWLSHIGEESAQEVRMLVQEALNSIRPSLREQLLALLTNDGQACLSKDAQTQDRWLSNICQTLIANPRFAQFYPAVSPDGPSAWDFLEHSLEFSSDHTEQDRRRSLRGLAEGMPKRSRQTFDRWLSTLNHPLTDYRSAAIWRHDRHSRALVRLTLFNEGNPTNSYFLWTPPSVNAIAVPEWVTARRAQVLVRVTDQDRNGRLELWWADRYEVEEAMQSDTECDGEEDSDLQRDVFCRMLRGRAVQALVEEVNGHVLTFPEGVPGKRAIPPRFEHWSFARNVSRIPASWRRSDQADPSCNRMLIGKVLGPTLAIADWSGASEDPRRVVRLVCKRHPLHADQTLVALFHEIPGPYDPYDVRPYGFAFAVLDMAGRRVIRLHQSTLEEDGGTNISGGDLEIDTGLYWLKKGTRALGVRMDIARSIPAADRYAGRFLTLFVEEGASLRPVLEGFPMYYWGIERTDDCVDPQWADEGRGDKVCEEDSGYLSLSLGAKGASGWRDLVVSDGEGATDSTGGGPPWRARLVYVNGRYEAEGIWPDW